MEKGLFNIRAGRIDDIPSILNYIKELATVEGRPEDVKATEKRLMKYLFGSEPIARVCMAEYDNRSIGFALYFYKFSTFAGQPILYLEDLFIQPKYRGHGFGKAFLKYFAQLAVEQQCMRMEWSVRNGNDEAVAFYQHLNARLVDAWSTFHLEERGLAQLAGTD